MRSPLSTLLALAFAPALSITLASCARGSDETGTLHSEQGPAEVPSAQSCVSRCGGASSDASCWCDSDCNIVGDCCADFASECAGTGKLDTGSGGSSAGGGGAAGSGGSSTGSGGGPTGSGGVGGSAAAGGTASGGASGTSGGSGASAGTTDDSCVGHCGGPSASGTCWCDSFAECQKWGDCCPDAASACGGGVAGGCTPELCNSPYAGSENGIECYCDALCAGYGDCCSNKAQICGV